MNVDPTGPVRPTQSGRRTERRSGLSGTDFSSHLDALDGAANVNAARQGAPVDALLAMQQIDPDADGDSQAKHRAHAMLEMLDELRRGLLAGSFGRGQLDRLAALAREQQHSVSDPRLRAVIDEIELRAAVEIAKLEREAGARV